MAAEGYEDCEPVYEDMPGWKRSTVGITDYDELPENARAYLARIQEIVATPIDIISTGPDRKETISVDNPFTHHMNVDYTAYEGFDIQGWSEVVLSRGRVICDNGRLVTEGGGQFIKRAQVNKLLR